MPASRDGLANNGEPAATGALCEAQLRQGFRTLRFIPELERSYRNAVMTEAHWPVLIITISAICIWSLFAVLDLFRLDLFNRWPPAPDIWLLLGLRWGMLAVLLICLVPIVRTRVLLDWKAFTVYLMLCAASAFTAVIYKANDVPAADAVQIVLAMAAFLPIGMRFYQALLASVGMVLLTILASLVWLPPEAWYGQALLIAVVIMGVPVGGMGAYLREYAHRRQFLLTTILEHQAQFDPLTDLANRRLFYRHANAAITHAARMGESLTLAIIDIDHFKSFNDRFGHLAGDAALQKVAEVIGDGARRPMDMAARLGGEEFALLLYDTDTDRAEPILQRLCNAVAGLNFDQPARLSISIGATALASGEDLNRIYARADQLLYRSKAEGRNRLTVG